MAGHCHPLGRHRWHSPPCCRLPRRCPGAVLKDRTEDVSRNEGNPLKYHVARHRSGAASTGDRCKMILVGSQRAPSFSAARTGLLFAKGSMVPRSASVAAGGQFVTTPPDSPVLLSATVYLRNHASQAACARVLLLAALLHNSERQAAQKRALHNTRSCCLHRLSGRKQQLGWTTSVALA